jgi:hypothetical protein
MDPGTGHHHHEVDAGHKHEAGSGH